MSWSCSTYIRSEHTSELIFVEGMESFLWIEVESGNTKQDTYNKTERVISQQKYGT